MHKLVALVILLASATTYAQLVPPTLPVRVISDASQSVKLKSGDIEIFPTQRAVVVSQKNGAVRAGAFKPSAVEKPFSPSEQGLVFNYALQRYGLVVGEIAFKLKPTATPKAVPVESTLEVRRVADGGIYTVWARTPEQWLRTVQALQESSAVLWVEPTIDYAAVR